MQTPGQSARKTGGRSTAWTPRYPPALRRASIPGVLRRSPCGHIGNCPQEHAVENRLRRTARRRAAIPAWEEPDPKKTAGKTATSPRRSGEPRPTVTWYQAIAWNLKRAKRRWRHILREKRASRFPESNRFPIQILLLIWGIFPMWGSLLQERLWGHRKRAISRGTSRPERPERAGHRVLFPLLFLGAQPVSLWQLCSSPLTPMAPRSVTMARSSPP